MALSTNKQHDDGYSDLPLNVRQQNAIAVIKQWKPVQNLHINCVKTAITLIRNVLYKPDQDKYRKIRLNQPKVQRVIVNVKGGVKLLKLAGFSQDTVNDEPVLIIERPSTIEELEQLTDIWLILMKTQFNWNINPDPNASKHAPLPKTFQLPNSIGPKMKSFIASNDIAQTAEFRKHLTASNEAKDTIHRYDHFGKAIALLIASNSKNSDFFNLNPDPEHDHGLNDVDPSDIAAMLTTEILSGDYDEDEAFTNLILAEDLRILAEKQGQIEQQYPINKVMNESEHCVDDEDEKGGNDLNEDEHTAYTVVDIGCGWGNVGVSTWSDLKTVFETVFR